jgi:hypothetical protein
MSSRIKTAGGDPRRLFTREAVELIHSYSGGIPRTINVVCDNALLAGMAVQRRPVDSDLVQEVCQDFDLSGAHVSVARTTEVEVVQSSQSAEDSAGAQTGAYTRRGSMFKNAAARGFALLGSRR